jgi:hypothetical protein
MAKAVMRYSALDDPESSINWKLTVCITLIKLIKKNYLQGKSVQANS